MPNKSPIPKEKWERLEKVWHEEGLPLVDLSKRFGIASHIIGIHLKAKYGFTRSLKEPKQRGSWKPLM